jgi:hypothetical protein
MSHLLTVIPNKRSDNDGGDDSGGRFRPPRGPLSSPLSSTDFDGLSNKWGLRLRFSVFGCRFSGWLAGFFNLSEFEDRISKECSMFDVRFVAGSYDTLDDLSLRLPIDSENTSVPVGFL